MWIPDGICVLYRWTWSAFLCHLDVRAGEMLCRMIDCKKLIFHFQKWSKSKSELNTVRSTPNARLDENISSKNKPKTPNDIKTYDVMFNYDSFVKILSARKEKSY